MAANVFILWKDTLSFTTGGNWTRTPMRCKKDRYGELVSALPPEHWLRTVPMLELSIQPSKLTIVPDSAVQMYNNCKFDAHGQIAAVSPALLRWMALHWSPHDTSRAFKHRTPAPEHWSAEKHRLGRIKPRLSLSARWKCRSTAHKHADVPLDELGSKYVHYNICRPCLRRVYVHAPSHWMSRLVMAQLLTNAFYKAVWCPLLARSWQQLLRGAVFADKNNFQMPHDGSYWDALVDCARVIEQSPVVHCVLKLDDGVKKQRKTWGQVLDLHTQYVLGFVFTPQQKKSNFLWNMDDYQVALASHGMADIGNQICATADHLLVRGLTNPEYAELVLYKEKELRVLFVKAFVQCLRLLTKNIAVKLTGFGVSDRNTESCRHPRELCTMSLDCKHLVVYQSEYLQWQELVWIFATFENLESLVLAGNYASARYGLATPCPGITMGACFTVLVDLAHAGVLKTLAPDKYYQNVTEYPTDKDYETRELAAFQTAYWPPTPWQPKTLYPFLREHCTPILQVPRKCPRLVEKYIY